MSIGSIIRSGVRFGWEATKVCYNKYQYVRMWMVFDSAVGNLLALETLRHGTCFTNWVKIQFQGADPAKGATAPGETQMHKRSGHGKGYEKDCLDHFFVSRDTADGDFVDQCGLNCAKRCLGTGFGCTSAIAAAYPPLQEGASPRRNGQPVMPRPLHALFVPFSGFLTPTLKFRFEGYEVGRMFQHDPSMPDTALRTPAPISPLRLGLTGSIYAGANSRILQRIRHKPQKFAMGLVQMGFLALCIRSQLGIGKEWAIFSNPHGIIRLPAKFARWTFYQAGYFTAW